MAEVPAVGARGRALWRCKLRQTDCCKLRDACTPTAQGCAGSTGADRIERQFGLCRIPGRFALYGVMIARDVVFVYTVLPLHIGTHPATINTLMPTVSDRLPAETSGDPRWLVVSAQKQTDAARVIGQLIGVAKGMDAWGQVHPHDYTDANPSTFLDLRSGMDCPKTLFRRRHFQVSGADLNPSSSSSHIRILLSNCTVHLTI